MVLFMLKPHYIVGHGIIVLEPVSSMPTHCHRETTYILLVISVCF